MNPLTVRILFAFFLIAHGLVPVSLTNVPVPAPGALRTPYLPSWWRTNIDSVWPASRIGLPPEVVQTAGWLLWLSWAVLLAAAGAGLLGFPGLGVLWQTLASAGAVLSLILLVFYWHPWLILGLLINAFILAGVFAGWFTRWFAVQ